MISEPIKEQIETMSIKELTYSLMNRAISFEDAEDIEYITSIVFKRDIAKRTNGKMTVEEEMKLIQHMHLTKLSMRTQIGLPIQSDWIDPEWDEMMATSSIRKSL